LVDLAVAEYQSGRQLVFRFWSTRDRLALGAMIRSVGYFEACISTLKHTINYLKKIRGYPSFQKDLKNLLPRTLTVLSGETERKISGLRNSIQHLENQIQRGKVTEGQAVYLKPDQDRLELGGHYILYSDLATWLTDLHQCSLRLFDYFSKQKS